MRVRIRVVMDTNVLVSAMLSSHSTPGQALQLAARIGDLLVSDATGLEAEEVIRRPKLDGLVSRTARAEFLVAHREAAKLVTIVSRIEACRDKNDDKFLDLAVDGRADAIVTGDDDLLALNPFRGVRILTPRQFLVFAEQDR